MSADWSPAWRVIATLQVTVAAPLALGILNGRERRLIPILGGSVAGPFFNGSILPGGSDVQSVRADGSIELLARYALDLGEAGMLWLENTGIRRVAADGSTSYFRGTLRFEAPAGVLAWLNDSVFVTSGSRAGNVVTLTVAELL